MEINCNYEIVHFLLDSFAAEIVHIFMTFSCRYFFCCLLLSLNFVNGIRFLVIVTSGYVEEQ
jgi:hypothetical protein